MVPSVDVKIINNGEGEEPDVIDFGTRLEPILNSGRNPVPSTVGYVIDWDDRYRLRKVKKVDGPSKGGDEKKSSKERGGENPGISAPGLVACRKQHKLRSLVRSCVRFISREHNIHPTTLRYPDACGQLRSAVRASFGENLHPIVELSIKTACKLEKRYCGPCGKRMESELSCWKEARFLPVEIDEGHAARFVRALSMNVDRGWNKRDYPFIPNGHATISVSRKDGGNWQREEFSELCTPCMVVSSGKPRVVTKYSAWNTEVLYPLHQSLYDSLGRKGWLLVGSPTDEHVRQLNGNGDLVSVDYSAATDNIKAHYTRLALEVLIEKGEGLTTDQIKCLRVLGSLRFSLDGSPATRGQPMGSMMSFPILCLINKAVVDMSLVDLLDRGEISFKEWTSHRCLINGDDLLFREPARKVALYDRIIRNGEGVGLKVNAEKTMIHAAWGEINSTLFWNGTKQKKSNCGALVMEKTVENVVELALEASRTVSGFSMILIKNLSILRQNEVKITCMVPRPFMRTLLGDARVSQALCLYPSVGKRPLPNPFPVVVRPNDYQLAYGEELKVIKDKVSELRDMSYRPPEVCEPKDRPLVMRSSTIAWKKKKPKSEETILKILHDIWYNKKWDELAAESRYSLHFGGWATVEFDGERQLSVIDKIVQTIRSGRKTDVKKSVKMEWVTDLVHKEVLRDGYISLPDL